MLRSKGFAFITYYNREDAQRAIDRLNGHGYDNLIMKVDLVVFPKWPPELKQAAAKKSLHEIACTY